MLISLNYNNSNLCLNANPVKLNNCNNNQNWIYDKKNGRLMDENKQYCLNVKNNYVTNPQIVLSNCKDAPEQHWIFTSNNKIQTAINSKLCLAPKSIENNSKITLTPCEWADAWNITNKPIKQQPNPRDPNVEKLKCSITNSLLQDLIAKNIIDSQQASSYINKLCNATITS